MQEKVRVYCWIGGDRPQDVGTAAKEKMEQGYTAVNMNGTEELHYIDSYKKIDAAVERVAAIRGACGSDFGIAVDFHGRVHKAMAKVLAKGFLNNIPKNSFLTKNDEYYNIKNGINGRNYLFGVET